MVVSQGKEGYRKRRIQKRRELGLEGFRSGGIQESWVLYRRDLEQERCLIGGMQESRRVAGKEGSGYEGCGTGKMLERRDT